MEGCLVVQPGPKRFTNVEFGGKTLKVSSTTFTADYLKNRVKTQSVQPIQNAIRMHNMPDATFDKIVAQAEVYITSRSYSQAVHHASDCAQGS